MPVLVCLGDSITAKEYDADGVAKLTPRLRDNLSNWTVINAGIGGENTRGALVRLQTDVLERDPDLVTVMLGTADASENKGIPIQEYENNLTSIVKQITPSKTLIISSPPIDIVRLSARKEAFPKSNFVTEENLTEYVAVAAKVADSTNSYFLDLWTIMQSQANYSRFLKLRDGVHLNRQGYEFFALILLDKIKSLWIYSAIA